MRRLSLVRGTVVLLSVGMVGAVLAQPAGGPPPRVGLQLGPLTDMELDAFQRAIGHRVGVRVLQVAPDSPAARASVKPQDVILAVNKQGVATPQEAVAALNAATGRVELTCARASGPGELTSLTLWLDLGGAPPVTGGAPMTTGGPPPVTGGGVAPPDVTTIGGGPEPVAVPETTLGGAPAHALGLSLQAFGPEEMDEVQKLTGTKAGVWVTNVLPGSPAAEAGIRDDDVLYQVGTTVLADPSMVEGALSTGGLLECKLWRADDDGKISSVSVLLHARSTPAGGGSTVTGTFGPAPAPQPFTPGPATSTVATQAGGPDVVRIQAQLQALDAARGAGILTDEEYARKRGELEAQLRAAMPPVIDEATRQKLAALDAARTAGILTDEEYARKRAELMGAAGGQIANTPALTPGALVGPTPTPGPATTALPPVAAGKKFEDPKGRFVVTLPEGYRGETPPDGPAGRVTGPLGSMDIIVQEKGPTAEVFLANVLEQVKAQSRNFREVRRGKIEFADGQGPFVECTGINPNGQQTTVFLAANEDGDQNSFLLIFEVPQEQNMPGRAMWQQLVKGFQMGTIPDVPFTWF
jgi:membrane-associated protease RseP (regulator of RpoE activity)